MRNWAFTLKRIELKDMTQKLLSWFFFSNANLLLSFNSESGGAAAEAGTCNQSCSHLLTQGPTNLRHKVSVLMFHYPLVRQLYFKPRLLFLFDHTRAPYSFKEQNWHLIHEISRSNDYIERAQVLVTNENLLLQTLGFDVNVVSSSKRNLTVSKFSCN